jgi:integrase
MTREEAQCFSAACHMPHIRLFTLLAMTTGARMSALLGLAWNRVDFDGKTIDLHDPDRPRTHKGRPTVAYEPDGRGQPYRRPAPAR